MKLISSGVGYETGRLGGDPFISALRLLAAMVLVRLLDVFWLRSDQIFGELIFTKLAGILIMALYLWRSGRSLRSLGLHATQGPALALLGLLCMAAALAVGYAAELGFLLLRGESPSLYWAAQGFSLLAAPGMGGGLGLAFGLLLGNAVNSTMEEAFFRGVLLSHFVPRYRPATANLMQAAIFGLWHVVWPLREYLDGHMSGGAALGMALGYALISGLVGWVFGAVFLRTGSLWWPWAAHTLNNSAHNFLHVAVAAGVAPTLGLRVAVATVALALLAGFGPRVARHLAGRCAS